MVITAAISLQPKASHATLAATEFLILILALSAVNYVLLPLLGFGAVWVFRVGKRLYLVSLGYCEGETILEPGVEVELSGFQVLAEFPLESEYHGRLWIRIGYFPPGIHWVELPERGFFFLRTRGVCALRDPYLPRDDEGALEMARFLEKLSMVYAAVCLEEGGPNPGRARKIMKHVKNNSRWGTTVRYFGVKVPLGRFTTSQSTTVTVAVLVALSLVSALARGEPLGPMGAPILVLSWLLACVLLALPVAWRNRRAVKTGRWYRVIFERHRVEEAIDKARDWNWFPDLERVDPLED